ncbi:MAG: hypothetical protein Aurels2KO_29330 [Aureliella sp.]
MRFLLLPFYTLVSLLAAASSVLGQAVDDSCYTAGDFLSVEKIDIHAHIHTDDTDFVSLSKRELFRFVNMAVWSSDAETNVEKHRTMWGQYDAEPDRTSPVCSFPLENWDDPDYVQQTIGYLKGQFNRGAVGVKIWKNIGMELRDASGKLVMVDDPKLDPIIDYIEQRGKVLLGHLGEPKNCWLPVEQMTVKNNQGYFTENPQYHMYLHPEMPSYEDQIAARDRMLSKHRGVKFVACHLGSLEWSVDRIAAFLDEFPNATVGVAARVGQLQYQSRREYDKVRSFFLKYADRILYGTDTGVRAGRGADKHAYVRDRWLRDWAYFCTDQEISVPELDGPVKGLALPKAAIDKIYRENALRVFTASWLGVPRKWKLGDLDWLAGSWMGQDDQGSVTEEFWMKPRGTLMLGGNRTVRASGKTSFEFMRLQTMENGIDYLASPSGRAPTAFRMTTLDPHYQIAVFESGANDFPSRITYDRNGNEMIARIDGQIGGQPRSMQWTWQLKK